MIKFTSSNILAVLILAAFFSVSSINFSCTSHASVDNKNKSISKEQSFSALNEENNSADDDVIIEEVAGDCIESYEANVISATQTSKFNSAKNTSVTIEENNKQVESVQNPAPKHIKENCAEQVLEKQEARKAIEGVVAYEQTVQIRSNLKGKQKMYALLVPKETKSRINLYFNESLARTVNVKENSSDNDVQIDLNMPEFLFDYKNKRTTQLSKLNGAKYAVSAPTKDKSSKIKYYTDEKIILGYKCKKAIVQGNGAEGDITVWYTDQIPVLASPLDEININGFVMEASTKSINIKATGIKFHDVDDNILRVPADYKQITESQYKNLQDEMASE